MEILNKLINEVNSRLTHQELTVEFEKIAHELLENFIIVKEGHKYAIREIEFYYHGEGYKDIREGAKTWTLTIKRTCPAGQWWFH